MNNPSWQKDELILALDLYFQNYPAQIHQDHPAVKELSHFLRALPIHPDRPDPHRFRNANSVYMKLCNFMRFDPTYRGRGLSKGGILERKIWQEFSVDKQRLSKTAAAIKMRLDGQHGVETISEPADGEDEFPEGKLLYRAHRSRERNRKLIELAKEIAVKRSGCLGCQACGFDFAKFYGPTGEGYIECHHVIPISEVTPGAKTKVADLALLCANCHRVIHRRRPWLSVGSLSLLISQETKDKLKGPSNASSYSYRDDAGHSGR